MEIAIFSSTCYERRYLDEVNANGHHRLGFFEVPLTTGSTGLATGYPAVCIFVNDRADAQVLEALQQRANAVAREAGRAADQHEPRRADRYAGRDRSPQIRSAGRPRDRRLRVGIGETTLRSATAFEQGQTLENEIKAS